MFPSPCDRARSVQTCRAMDSVCRALWPSDLGFLYQRFSLLVATKLSVLKPAKQKRWSGANHGSIRDSWSMAFSGCPRGPRVACETKCPRHIVPNFTAETRSRTRVSQEPDGHHRRRSPAWSGLDQRHSSCLWFQRLGVEAHSSLPYDQHDRGNFSSQGQARHLRPHPFGQQRLIEPLEWTRLGRGNDCRALE